MLFDYNMNILCFVGRVVAKAIYDNKLLDAYFTRSFYKHILGIPVKVSDMEAEDYSFYQGLVYLLEHDIDEIGVELTFSTDVNTHLFSPISLNHKHRSITVPLSFLEAICYVFLHFVTVFSRRYDLLL